MFMKFIAGLIYCSIGFLCLERLCHKATDGFARNKIICPIEYQMEDGDAQPSIESQAAYHILTSQPFYYFNSGAQSYTFLSEDRNYVVKFFKFQHMRIPPWMNYIPLPEDIDTYRQHKINKKKQLTRDVFNSFSIAYHKLRDETGLVYLHLGNTHFMDGTMRCYDKIGVRHDLDLDTTYYVVQRRADLAYSQINYWMQYGRISEARAGIRSLVELSLNRCLKGIYDKDPDFSTNFGFVDGKAVQIDIGRFSENKGQSDPAVYKHALIHITHAFREWLKKHHDVLVEVLDEEIERIGQI